MRGAILGSQGVSFVLQVRRLPNGEGNDRGREQDQTEPAFLLPGSIPSPLWLEDVTSMGSLSPVGMGIKQKRENEQPISQPRAMPGETASSAAF